MDFVISKHTRYWLRHQVIISSSTGNLFTLLATITGAIWAKFSGVHSGWDRANLNFSFFFAHVRRLLRAAANGGQRGTGADGFRRYMSFCRCSSSLPHVHHAAHYGRLGRRQRRLGPVLSTKKELNLLKRVIFFASICGFTMLFFWMLSCKSASRRCNFANSNNPFPESPQ